MFGISCAGFGLASHLGVLSGIPCVGVSKKLYHVDGLEKSPQHKEKVKLENAYIETCTDDLFYQSIHIRNIDSL